MGRTVLVACAVGCLIGGVVASSHAEPKQNQALRRAKKQLADLGFLEALESLKEALAAGGAAPNETAEIYRLLGEVEATLGNTEAAVEHFHRYLSLDPSGTMAEGASPKITQPFDLAKKRLDEAKPLELSHSIESENPPTVAVILVEDPLRMVARLRADYVSKSGANSREIGVDHDAQEILVKLPRGTRKTTVSVLDKHGNELRVLGTGDSRIEFAAPKQIEVAPPPRREVDDGGFNGYWMISGGVAVGFAAFGTLAGLSAQSKADKIEERVEAGTPVEYGTDIKPLEDDAKRSALAANIAFAAAGATAVLSVVLYLRSRGDGDDESTDRSAIIVPIAGRDSAGVAAAIQF